MPVYLRKDLKEPIYWYRFQIKGIRFHGTTGCSRKSDAEAAERRIKAEERERAGRPRETLDLVAARWWSEIGELGGDAETSGIRLERIVKGLGPTTLLQNISFDMIAAFAARRRKEPTIHGRLPAAATVNREIQLLRRVLRRAVKWGYEVSVIDWGALLAPEPQEKVVELSPSDEARITQGLADDWNRFFAFLVVSGWRVSAVAALEWSDVQETVVERPGKRGRLVRAIRTETVNAILDGQKGAHPTHVFAMKAVRTTKTTVRGTARIVDRHKALREWYRACDAAGVRRICVHDLRHTAATRMLRATGSLSVTQKLLGHTRATTTQRYAHVLDDDLRAAMEAVEKRTVKRTVDDSSEAKFLKIGGSSKWDGRS